MQSMSLVVLAVGAPNTGIFPARRSAVPVPSGAGNACVARNRYPRQVIPLKMALFAGHVPSTTVSPRAVPFADRRVCGWRATENAESMSRSVTDAEARGWSTAKSVENIDGLREPCQMAVWCVSVVWSVVMPHLCAGPVERKGSPTARQFARSVTSRIWLPSVSGAL